MSSTTPPQPRIASSRISELVGALKSYSYLGQAPVQDVDIHEGLDNTLVILRHKLKTGIGGSPRTMPPTCRRCRPTAAN